MSGTSSLRQGAISITVATAISRVTGFVRVVTVAAAMGTTFLANVYQTANTAPNVVFELVAAGVLTSVFVPAFVEQLVRGTGEGEWEIANIMSSVAVVALVGLSILVALAAPLIMSALTVGVRDADLRAREVALGTRFLRLFAPQIAFYGAGMIMTAALHARRRFAIPAIAPIFNNVVVIGVYLTFMLMQKGEAPTVRGTTSGEIFLLGAGTTLGVIAMTLCLVPQLRRLGWRFSFRFEPSHPVVKRAARMGGWALGYAGGYQAGLIVVLLLANGIRGGVAAYQWAYTFFYLPHALFGVPIFNVLFTAMAEHVARGEEAGLRDRLRDGLAMLAFILVPVAAFLFAAAHPLADATLRFGVMTEAGARQVARVLEGFAVGLPTYSAFLVYTRAFYAIGDTKTPTVLNAVSVATASAAGAALFFVLPEESAVQGLALGHSIGFAVGAVLLARLFTKQAGPAGRTRLGASIRRALAGAALALLVMVAIELVMESNGGIGSALELVAVAAAGALTYVGVMRLVRAPELDRLLGSVRSLAS